MHLRTYLREQGEAGNTCVKPLAKAATSAAGEAAGAERTLCLLPRHLCIPIDLNQISPVDPIALLLCGSNKRLQPSRFRNTPQWARPAANTSQNLLLYTRYEGWHTGGTKNPCKNMARANIQESHLSAG